MLAFMRIHTFMKKMTIATTMTMELQQAIRETLLLDSNPMIAGCMMVIMVTTMTIISHRVFESIIHTPLGHTLLNLLV